MKILFCLNSLYHIGGSERVWIDRVNYLAQKTNYQIFIITTDQNKKKYFMN